jgi:hypothetical protein
MTYDRGMHTTITTYTGTSHVATDTTGDVTLTIGDPANAERHIEVKVTHEGVIVEVWDEPAGEFSTVYKAFHDDLLDADVCP